MTQRLDPKSSAQFIAGVSKNVKINQKGIDALATMVSESFERTEYEDDFSQWKEHELHPKVADEGAIDWIFVVDSLNFSFWSQPQTQYTISFRSKTYTGYWSLCAAINRALEEGISITDPNYYANITEKEMRHVFRGEATGCEIPLLTERVRILNESGRVLLEKFGGRFSNCVKQCNRSARALIDRVVENFGSFRDEASYNGQQVSFYKRAQILVADIWGCFEGKLLGCFEDIDTLTMFADYRVPQVLVHFQALEYSPELMSFLRSNQMMKNGDDYEIEIRGLSIWAIELIRDRIKAAGGGRGQRQVESVSRINAVLLDFFLWDYRRKNSQQIDASVPFHKVRCIYY